MVHLRGQRLRRAARPLMGRGISHDIVRVGQVHAEHALSHERNEEPAAGGAPEKLSAVMARCGKIQRLPVRMGRQRSREMRQEPVLVCRRGPPHRFLQIQRVRLAQHERRLPEPPPPALLLAETQHEGRRIPFSQRLQRHEFPARQRPEMFEGLLRYRNGQSVHERSPLFFLYFSYYKIKFTFRTHRILPA